MALFSRNRITTSAWKSKQIFFPQGNCIGTHSPSWRPVPTKCKWTRGKFVTQRENFRLPKGSRQLRAADQNQMERSCYFSSHQVLSQGCLSCCDPALEPGKFSASQWRWTEDVISELRACAQKQWCAGTWVTRGSAVPAWRDTASCGGLAQGSGGPSHCCYTSVKTHTFRLTRNNLNKSVCASLLTSAMKKPGNYY